MGFISKALTNFGGRETPLCPTCGRALSSEGLGEGSYWCGRCGSLLTEYGGELVDVKSLRQGGSHGRTCEMCQSSLNDGDHYLPYEDGSNAQAYIRCRCGHENIQYGFGGDDD